MSNELIRLNQIVESEKSNDVKIQELKTFLHKYQQVAKPKIDWKLVAGHLDMSIFEFILDNLNDEKIKNLELQLSKQKNLIRLTGIGIIVTIVILLVVT